MPDSTAELFEISSFDRRKIECSFTGGEVSSDGGVMALRAADRRLGLCEAIDAVIKDPRHQELITHRQIDLMRQRIYGLALGYEDLNDHDRLRDDLVWQSAVERDEPLASSPTLCRLENRMDRRAALEISKVFVEQFIASFEQAPEELVLDFDATDDQVHGNQQGRFFHGYYRGWCFLPLYVFCGEQLLVSYLRPSNTDGARHAWAVLKLLTLRLRQAFPDVRIIFRGDSGFCRHRMLGWCENHGIDYVVGIAQNARLRRQARSLADMAQYGYELTGEKQRLFECFDYAAGSWDRPRRVIAKAEHGTKGSNPRFILSTLDGDPQAIYDSVYCARGEMENRIKEQQLGLFADRTSCSDWWANQFRLLLASSAYILIETIRRVGLSGTPMARAQVSTIRLRLLKIGTIILRNTRRIRLLFANAFPLQSLFTSMMLRLDSS